MKKTIIIATSNQGKVNEYKQLFDFQKFSNIEFISLAEFLNLNNIKDNIDVVEDGFTFKENALKKAIEISKFTNLPCLADDSGIIIPALNGWPGIYTNRLTAECIGDTMSHTQRNNYILERAKHLKGMDRKVIWRTSIASFSPNMDKPITVSADLEGVLANCERGENGFSFDYIFQYKNGKTLSELSQSFKNDIGARKKALQEIYNEIDFTKL